MYARTLVPRLLMAVSLIGTILHGAGYAQSVGTGGLPPDLKSLLEELRKDAGDASTPVNASERSPGAVSAPPPEDGYEAALSRYHNLQGLIGGAVGNGRLEPVRQFEELESQLAEAAKTSPPQPVEKSGSPSRPEQAAEGHLGGVPPVSPSVRLIPSVQQLADDYDRLIQRLEDLAAWSRERARQLKHLPK